MVTRSATRGPGRGSVPTRSVRGPRPASEAAGATARELLSDAGRGLGCAMRADTTAERYAAAHLAGLRAAASLLAVRVDPAPRRTGRHSGPTRSTGRSGSGRGNVWDALARVAPELTDWAAFYRAGVAKRQLAEAGIGRTIGVREADELVRQTGEFLEIIERLLPVRRGTPGARH